MSANTTRPCHHCGRVSIPTEHRCDGKAKAIASAQAHYQNRALRRPKQVWRANQWHKEETVIRTN